MPTAKAKGSTNFDPVPEGLHIGVCYAVIGLGTQEVMFKEKKKLIDKVCLIWELPDVEKIDIDGVMLPRVISNIYTNSIHKKAILRQHLESWRGKAFTDEQLEGFNLDVLLGANCQIQVIHNHADGNTYANISTIVNVPANHKKVASENPPVVYDIGNPIPEDKIPSWLVDKIKEAQEWKVTGTDAKSEPSYDEKPPVPDEASSVEPF